MKFNRIVCLSETGFTSDGLEQLQDLSRDEVRCFSTPPVSDEESIDRLRGADCVLVKFDTRIPGRVLEACPDLKFIALCCSLYGPESSNVDIATAERLGIEVRGIRDYGDEGVVEFIFSQLISLFKGMGEHRWKDEPVELGGKRLGIIGMGTTGQMVAQAASLFGMEVWYHSRTRKPELEGENLRYASLPELLSHVDVVTTHLPRDTRVLDADAFARMKPGSVLVNTSLGPTFDVPAFVRWMERGENYAIFDGGALESQADELTRHPNVLYIDEVSGWTAEARARLTSKVLHNIRAFLRSDVMALEEVPAAV